MHKKVLPIILISLIILSIIFATFFFYNRVQADPSFLSFFGGPNTISTGEKGTWFIGINTLSWNRVYYRIDWGDGDDGKNGRELKSSVMPGEKQITINHIYKNTGNYTIKLLIKNRAGQIANPSIHVTVLDPNDTIDPLTPDTNFVAPDAPNSSSTNCFVPWTGEYVKNGINGNLDTQLNLDYKINNYPGLPPNPTNYSCLNGQLTICNSSNTCRKFSIKHSDPNNTCREDVMTCPDGSFSERVGPTCNFQACPNVDTSPKGTQTCKTPWGGKIISSGALISSEPWFTNGQHTESVVVPIMKCLDSVWQQCDYLGNNCKKYVGI